MITFDSGALHHIYQRAVDLGVIFYSDKDRLVYYTLAAVKSKQHNVRVAAAAIMYTHIHQSVQVDGVHAIDGYLHDLNTSFARLYNHHYSRKGELFQKPPGKSQKLSSKTKRSNIIYVFNNHVEKGLCQRAENERWSLLAYATSESPFSQPLNVKTCSRRLLRAKKLVDRRVDTGKALEYIDLDGLFSELSETEREQFIDYSIIRYSLIDFRMAASLFDGMQNLIISVHSSVGNEYDIKEDRTKFKDTAYVKLCKYAHSNGFLMSIYSMDDKKRREIIQKTKRETGICDFLIGRFFHISG